MNAVIGIVRSMLAAEDGWQELLHAVQRELMVVMSHVATPSELFPGKKNQDHREDILFLQFRIKNQNPSSDVSITLEKERNKLSARSHIYYNHNETFTYAVPLRKGQKDIALTLGTGD